MEKTPLNRLKQEMITFKSQINSNGIGVGHSVSLLFQAINATRDKLYSLLRYLMFKYVLPMKPGKVGSDKWGTFFRCKKGIFCF